MATIDYGQGPVELNPDLTGRASGTGFNLPTAPTIPAPTYAGPTPAQQAANSNPHPNGIAGATGPTASAPYGVDPSGNPYPSSAAASGERSAGSIYGGTGNSDLDAALAAAGESYKKAAFAPDPSDPAVQAQIRAATLASFQAEIDATNGMYASKLADAKRLGAGRVGSGTAVQARSGLLGSDFGTAQTDNINQGNESVYSGIREEQNAKIQAILTQSRNESQKAIEAATKARADGLDAYIKHLQSAQERKTTNATAAAAAVLQAGIDPASMTPAQLSEYLPNYGIDKSDLVKAYIAAKPEFDKAKTKAAADAQAAADAHLKSGADISLTQAQTTDIPAKRAQEAADAAERKRVNDSNIEKNRIENLKTYAEIHKIQSDAGVLSIKDAQALGVPYGTTKGEAIKMGKVPGASDTAGDIKKQALTSAQDLLDKFDKGSGTSAVGKSRVFHIQNIPGTAAKDFEIQFGNVKSLLSLDNVKLLKGQGAVSDAERDLLAKASAKLDLTQSEGEFKQSLKDLVKSLSGTSGTVQMRGPDNVLYEVPSDQVDAFIKAGGKKE